MAHALSWQLLLDKASELIEESEPIFREAKNQLEMNKMRDQSRSQPYIS